jgi:hypothetical protein
MVLVPCEWAAGGPVILVWCPVNGLLCGIELVLVVQLCWYGTIAGLELKFYDVDIFKF